MLEETCETSPFTHQNKSTISSEKLFGEEFGVFFKRDMSICDVGEILELFVADLKRWDSLIFPMVA